MLKKTILVLMAALGLTMSVKAITTVHTLAEALSQGYKPLPDPNWLYYLATDIPVGDGTWNHTIQFVNPTPKFASLDVKAFRPDKTKEGYIHLSVDLLQAKGDKVYIGSVSSQMIIQGSIEGSPEAMIAHTSSSCTGRAPLARASCRWDADRRKLRDGRVCRSTLVARRIPDV
jgi:hypothetical protein